MNTPLSNEDVPAFPCERSNEHFAEPSTQFFGLSKRELFAAMAMQGQIQGNAPYSTLEDCAKASVAYADALLTALQRVEP